MRKFYRHFLYKTNLLILLFGLFFLTCFGQNGQTSRCKATDYYCLGREYAAAISPKCKGKEDDCWITEYTKIIESNPNDGIAYFERGFLSVVKAPDLAILDFSKVIELIPTYKNAYVLLAMAYQRKGDYSQAIRVLNKLIELFPKDDNAYFNRGYVYSRLGDFDKALADYNKAIELSPRNGDYYRNRGSVYSSQGYDDKAYADYNKAVEVNPDEWLLYFSRGAFYWVRGEKAKAVSDFQMAKQLADPEEWQKIFVKILKPEIVEELKKLDASLLTSSVEEAAQIAAYRRFGLGSFSFSCNDNSYKVVTTYKDFANTPSWKPEKEDTPLSVHKALQVARKTLSQCYPEENNWIPSAVTLKSVGNDKWVYRVEFECPTKSCFDNGIVSAKFFVKLDGTVILPKTVVLPKTDAKSMKKFDSNMTSRVRVGSVAYLFSCDGNNYTVELAEKDFVNTPSWNPEDEVIAPLSFRDALQIARTTMNQCNPKADNNWNVRNVKLNPMGNDKWVYEIGIECPRQSCGKTIDATLYIKLDGTPILPKPDAKPTEKLTPSFGIPSGRP